jgi:hypothetical protein
MKKKAKKVKNEVEAVVKPSEAEVVEVKPIVESKTMRTEKAKKVYIDKDGNESRHASAEAIALIFRFANGHEVAVKPSELKPDIVICAALHGLSQKGGDSYAGVSTIAQSIEKCEALFENLKEGVWINRADGAIRTTVLAEALHRAKGDKYPTVEEAAEAITEWNAEKRKAVLDPAKGVPQLIAAYAEIQAERAKARADKLGVQAGQADTEGWDAL